MSRKILPHKAMSIYLDELDFIQKPEVYDELIARRIASEMDDCYKLFAISEARRIARETEACWNEYFELQRIALETEACYEQSELEELECIVHETDICWMEYELMMQEQWEQEERELEDDDEQNNCCFINTEVLSGRTGSFRRRAAARKKKELRRNAMIAEKNSNKRMLEDIYNMSFCKRRGGQFVKMPKFRLMKADKLWARAKKMKLV